MADSDSEKTLSDYVDTVPASQDFRYPFVLDLLNMHNLDPEKGKIEEEILNQFNEEVKKMKERTDEITNVLIENYDKRDPRDKKRPLQDSGKSNARSYSGQTIPASQDFRYPYVFGVLHRHNLVPGTGKIGDQILNQFNAELKKMTRKNIEITNALKKNYDKRDPKEKKDKKLPFQDSDENADASPPRKQRKLEAKIILSPRTHPYLIRFSEDVETQIQFVNGMIAYHSRNGVYPIENDDAMQDFTTVVLEQNIRLADLYQEIESLWSWCLTKLKDLKSLSDRESELIRLIRIFWYDVSREGPALNFGKEDATEAEKQESSFQGHDIAARNSSSAKKKSELEKQGSLQGHVDKKDGNCHDIRKASSSASARRNVLKRERMIQDMNRSTKK